MKPGRQMGLEEDQGRKAKGLHQVLSTGVDQGGQTLSPGVILRLQDGMYVQTYPGVWSYCQQLALVLCV